ncbi:MarC family protein [Paludibacterium paludis]|uniref:UPF0056 membrane protein n=1 Tax=Paludibacterium paludis TaxID=1225769 RepID=A0A918P139_9NEIS|nr:MarC family protein [Paludibacterium paludis]GGY12725.1 UPF0056 inner membrane protein [Paludibacterium paludis]
MLDSLVTQFVLMWAVIDPVGTIPVFLDRTSGFGEAQKRNVAKKAVMVSAGILLFFLAAGQLLLEGMKVPLPAFQVAGGLVLFLFALTMIFGAGKPESEQSMPSAADVAVFPLAVPSIASPGAMLAVVLLTDNHRFAPAQQAVTALLMLLVLFATYGLLVSASRLHRHIGDIGASVVSRVMGLILASIAVSQVLDGIKASFGLAG